jgi:hypothetical protein
MSSPPQPAIPRAVGGQQSAEGYRARKRALVEYRGGRCSRCGFVPTSDDDLVLMDFHHREAASKRFPLGAGALNRTWESLLAEAEKCDLVCVVCHRRIHAEYPVPNVGRPRGSGKWRATDEMVIEQFSNLPARTLWEACEVIASAHRMRPNSVYQRVRRTFARQGVPFAGREQRRVLSDPDAKTGRDETAAPAPET